MIEEFERHLRGTNLSENTVTSYLFAVRQFGERHEAITKRNLKEHKAWLIEQYKPKTVNLRIRAINCYLESIGKDSWKLSSIRVQQKAFLENVISEADYIYFKNCLKRDDNMLWYFVIRFLAATGARVSELVQIKVEHIKLGHLDLYSKGGKLRRIYIPKSLQDETVVLLSKGEIDSKKVRVEFSLEDMDMSGFQKGATYEQIKAYVLEHTGLKVSSLYISQIKRKCGLDVGQNYNLSKKEDAKVPKCPPEKEAAIRDALKYFQMI